MMNDLNGFVKGFAELTGLSETMVESYFGNEEKGVLTIFSDSEEMANTEESKAKCRALIAVILPLEEELREEFQARAELGEEEIEEY